MRHLFDRRPILVALAGPNGAGKTTFYLAHIEPSGLPFLNPDLIAAELRLTPEDATMATTRLRETLVGERESFVFETVFSDPVGDKIGFLKDAAKSGYTVVLCFIGLAGSLSSEERVAMRVSQGGHDVPSDKLVARYPRTMANLQTAIVELPHVYVFDNEDLRNPFRKIAVFENGRTIHLSDSIPKWFRSVLPNRNR
jgi:predicted ABC-type ATPase